MVIFPFTKKKFLSLSNKSRHEWIIKWLSQIYQELTTNRLKDSSCLLFFSSYSTVLYWMGATSCPMPEGFNTRAWIEFVSDSIHHHRIQSGISTKDHDLLPRINNEDKKFIEKRSACFNYHIALDGLRSLFNTGSIFRTCDAGGFESVILGNTPGAEHPIVRKTSMGTCKWIPYTKTADLASTLCAMKKQGFEITGIETAEDSQSYTDHNWQKQGVIVLGNEEYGISSHVMRACDNFVHIPMFGKKNSINVANAASIIIFHIASILS